MQYARVVRPAHIICKLDNNTAIMYSWRIVFLSALLYRISGKVLILSGFFWFFDLRV